MYVVHPYHPFVLPFRGLVITGITDHQIESMILNSAEYSMFRETTNIFKNQMAAGNHVHVTQFEYSMDFSYESDVYEVKDRYFDAISLNHDESSNELNVYLTEPFVQPSINNSNRKNWRDIRAVGPTLFFKGAESIDAEIESLAWKADYIGIITYKNKAYFVGLKQAIKERERDDSGFLEMPDFLNVKIYSHGNMLSRIFEEAVKNYLTENYQYTTVNTRYKPLYLDRGELDVFGEKGDRLKKYITVCECKFRLSDRNYAVDIDDVNTFKRKKEKVE